MIREDEELVCGSIAKDDWSLNQSQILSDSSFQALQQSSTTFPTLGGGGDPGSATSPQSLFMSLHPQYYSKTASYKEACILFFFRYWALTVELLFFLEMLFCDTSFIKQLSSVIYLQVDLQGQFLKALI